jgi:putative DNA primase/helicase
MTAPYANAARDYLDRGYYPLPLPAGRKKSPPDDFTGGSRRVPSIAQVDAWIAARPNGNIALRLPSSVVGIDVDHYTKKGKQKRGLDQLAELEAELGALPPTVMSTSRSDGSGIRLFRIPPGTALGGDIAPDIEMIRANLRYVIAAPSTNPENDDAVYRWIDSHTGEVYVDPWDVDQLPALPDTWVERFRSTSIHENSDAATPAEVMEFRATHTDNSDPRRLIGLRSLAEFINRDKKCRHDTLVHVACEAAREAAAGAYPFTTAEVVLDKWWREVMDDPTRHQPDRRSGLTEFDDAIAWAIAQANGNPDSVAQVRAEIAYDPLDSVATTTPAPGPPALSDIESGAHSGPTVALVAEPISTIDQPIGPDGFHFTDKGNADRLIAAHGDHLRYVPAWKEWIEWDGTRWRRDIGEVHTIERGKSIGGGLWRHVATMLPTNTTRKGTIEWAKRSESAQLIANAVRLARGIPGVAIDYHELDSDPWALNVVNGTVDLRTGQLRPHDPERLHSMIAGARYETDAEAPRWDRFLATILPDPEVRAYVQRAVGYSATGLTTEQVMFLAIGGGSNGKSTMVNALTAALGDYAGTAAKELIVAQRHDPHPTSAADLFRLRFAVAMETESQDRLAEARVKALTGSDRVKARRMHENFWEFEPTHKIWLAANHLPTISGTDHGTWRRLRVIPFDVRIEDADRDPNLPTALAAELPGILRWIVDGCIAWQEHNLNTPEQVRAATADWQLDSDWLAEFLDDAFLEIGDGVGSITAAELGKEFANWQGIAGASVNTKQLARELERRGCRKSRSGSTRKWVGIAKRSVSGVDGRWDVA